MRLHNQGQRVIHFGLAADQVIKPKEVADVSDNLGEKLVKLYPHELVDLDNLKVAYKEEEVKDFVAPIKPAKGGKSSKEAA